ncbi:DUF1801 domain-containing protein [Pararhodobacter sp. CCB-MM2]|uniref:DUF1801 domain-containing protein n=1 Tax=Pararhodobacter sp. CCB-MM2 TaxID=1786003 RepID=UPI00082DC8DC|nr:DUF1801 domain-containing protein [Pararhodobacter sp. CCB-MM2]
MADPVTDAIDTAPEAARAGLHALRAMIHRVAAEEGIALNEGLRWGQPAFLAPKGSSLRIGRPGKASKDCADFALYVHCQTPLIAEFIAGPGAGQRVEGTRAVLFRQGEVMDEKALAFLIRRALTWHAR